jgi:hypothetical protein
MLAGCEGTSVEGVFREVAEVCRGRRSPRRRQRPDARTRRGRSRERGQRKENQVASCKRVLIRTRLYAAAAKTNAQPTFARARCRVLRSPATVSSQPKSSSTRLWRRWLLASPGCRVVRASMALRRRVVFCATCGVTIRSRISIDPGNVASPRHDARPAKLHSTWGGEGLRCRTARFFRRGSHASADVRWA